MSKRNGIMTMAGCLAAIIFLFAPQVFSVWWDGNFTNLQTKGILRPQGQMQLRTVTLTPVSGTGFSINSNTDGTIFLVDPGHSTIKGDSDKCPVGNASTGVTVVVAAPVSATDDRIIGIQNIGTGGVTPIVVQFDGSEPIHTTSGTTAPGIFDAEGDILWLSLQHNSEVSGYEIARIIE